jgi:hypothetical protein
VASTIVSISGSSTACQSQERLSSVSRSKGRRLRYAEEMLHFGDAGRLVGQA